MIERLTDNQSEEDKYNQYLQKEQSETQKHKEHERLLDDYSELVFSPETFYLTAPPPTQKFIDQYCGSTVSKMEELFDKIIILKGKPITWVDMGGGKGLAMRQIGTSAQTRENIDMINVDLFDYDLQKLNPKEEARLKQKYPAILNPETKPTLIKANSEVVKLPKKADIITSIESIQYLNNPLLAICNWYNQLVDGGILIITRKYQWSGSIRFRDYPPRPFDSFLNTLQDSGVPFEVNKSDKNDCNLVVIEKKPNTSLVLQSPIKKIWIDSVGSKKVYYEENGPLIEIKEVDNANVLNYKEMNKIVTKTENSSLSDD